MKPCADKPVALANEFSRVLHEWLGAATMKEVVDRNKTYAPGTCASHDFCDANMAMEEAARNLGFTEIYEFGSDTESDEEAEYRANLWNRAWDLALEAEFKPIQERMFAAVWSSYAFKPGIEEVRFDFFTEDKGYSREEIEQINRLELSQRWESHHYGDAHVVIRIR